MKALHSRWLFPLALSLGVSGCGPELADLDGYTAIDCTKDRPDIDDLKLPQAVDSVQLYSVSREGDYAYPVASAGQPCATATDVPACQAGLKAESPTVGFHAGCHLTCSSSGYVARTTRGDEVKTYATVESLGELLGTVDTAQEAALLVYASNYSFFCGKTEQGGVKANADGSFNVIGLKTFACGEGPAVVQYVTQVSPTGEVRALEQHVMRDYKDDCSLDM